MNFTSSDYSEGLCTRKQFVDQYSPIRLEVGKVYQQESELWCHKQYKILYIDNHIAVGICVANSISNRFIGDYEMFYVNDGFKYNDTLRPNYRLVREIVGPQALKGANSL